MRIRRSKARTVTLFAKPERQFLARREVSLAPIHNIYSFYKSESSESDSENVDIETHTLEQYLALDLNNTRKRSTCLNNLTFEVKGQLISELRKISFSGGPTDSVVEHISNVLKIASIFNAQDSTLIQIFPLTLEGIAKRWPMLATAYTKIDVYGKKISLGVGHDQVVFKTNKKESHASISPICVINEFDKTQEFDNLVMNDEKKRDFESYLSPEYGSQDIISLSPSNSAEINEDSSMTLCDPNKRMSIGLEDFVDIDDMWDDLGPGILTNEKAKIEFLKSDGKIHLHNPDNLKLSCK
ncbi:hypothetical protein Tco_0856423 [Tanacetum coccineum]|uniref:Uncharacterized protein n=1 Tax=Tanacetum coccineum TaxID=301880 RepID=A0ABQ5B3B0_9ASTR